MSWEVSSTPVEVSTVVDGKKLKPLSTLVVNSTETDAEKLAELEKILYGGDDTEAHLPLPDEVIALVGVMAATPEVSG